MEKPTTDLEETALSIAVEHYVEVWDDNVSFYDVYQVLNEGRHVDEIFEDVYMDNNIGIPHWEPKYLAKKIDQLYNQITFAFE